MARGGLAAAVALAGLTTLPAPAAQSKSAPAGAAGQAAVNQGADAWEAGNYARALAIWRPLATAGNRDAQYNLAQAYRLGRGVDVDVAQARDWYLKSARQGHAQAQANYGLMLFQANDRKGALPWLTKAAERGDPRAQYVVGTALFNGDVAGKDWVRGYALMTRAAAAGLPQAVTSLAEMDKYVPLAQRQQGNALALDMERSELLSKIESPQAGTLVRAAPPTPVQPTKSAPSTRSVEPPRPVEAIAAAAVSPPPSVASSAPPQRVRPLEPRPAPQPAKPPRPAPSPATDGGWRVQVGAYANPAKAGAVWDAIAGKVPGVAARSYLVKAGAVTRLQAGPFASRADAARACTRIAATGTSCFAVNVK